MDSSSAPHTSSTSSAQAGALSRLKQDFKNLIPAPSDQTTSLWQDVRRRFSTYFNDVATSPAVGFGAGNTAYAAFIGNVAGMDIGPTGAASIQLAITLATVTRQVVSTYNGESAGAPFRIQAASNFATALLFGANSVSNLAHGEVKDASMMALPVATFLSWGAGHWAIANFLDRMADLKNQGLSDEDMSKDPMVRRFNKQFLSLYGAADIIAPWKNMTLDEVAQTLTLVASDPTNLSKGQFGSVLSLPFFAGGLTKTFATGSIGRGLEAIERTVLKFIPEGIKKALGMDNGVNPNHYYASGYAAGSAFALANGQPLFAAAQALWGSAYGLIAKGSSSKPVSADDYTAQISLPTGNAPR